MNHHLLHKKISVAFVVLIVATLFQSFNYQVDTQKNSKPSNPNIIIILTDDQGYADVGFNGCTDIPTPNIDNIAKNGVLFTNAYVSYAVCAPSRAGLLTGRYQDKFGFSRNPLYQPLDSTIGLSTNEQLMPDFLQKNGYNTYGVGKWHLGAHEKFIPWNRGFKEFFGFLGGGHRYFPEDLTIANYFNANNEEQSYRTKLIRNTKTVDETEYITDALSREAVQYIDKNKENPFFLYVAYNAPHAPLQATEKYLQRFGHITDTKRKTYAAMVGAVDDGVGLIINKLKQLKIDDNTIVIFLSDNGGPQKDNASNNYPLRAGKGSLFEGGIRVPFAMQWPAKIKPNTVYKESIISLDIFATVAANIAITCKPKNSLDGVNILPFINGTIKNAPHPYLFWRQFDQKNYAVLHQSGVKQVIVKDTVYNYFNLKKDIAEKTNLVASNNPLFVEMNEERKKWEALTIPPAIWGLNQAEEYKKMKQKTN